MSVDEFGKDLAERVRDSGVGASKAGLRDVYGSFFVAESEFAISVSAVQEVVNAPSEYQRMPLSPDYLLGLFNLRGMVIPVVDMASLFGIDRSDEREDPKVAIVEYGEHAIGLLFDRTGDVFDANTVEKTEFHSRGSEEADSLIKGVFKLDKGKRILQVLDPYKALGLKQIPLSSGISQVRKRRKNYSTRRQCISFVIGDVLCGLDIKAIQEIVQVDRIETRALASDICLGAINLRGAIVPIVDFQSLLGFGMASQPSTDEIRGKRVIVMRSGEYLFGLLVNSVESIVSFYKDELVEFPVLSSEKRKMYQGCVCLDEGNIETILLSHEEILSNSEIDALTKGHANLFSAKQAETSSEAKVAVSKTYICFTVNSQYGVEIGSVNEVLSLPDNLMQPPGLSDFYSGMVNLRGEMIAVVDPDILYSTASDKPKVDRKLMIVTTSGQKFGLIVDSVDSIVSIDTSKTLKLPDIVVKAQEDAIAQDVESAIQFKDSNGEDQTLLVLSFKQLLGRIEVSKSA